jgi:hypothetical protein
MFALYSLFLFYHAMHEELYALRFFDPIYCKKVTFIMNFFVIGRLLSLSVSKSLFFSLGFKELQLVLAAAFVVNSLDF